MLLRILWFSASSEGVVLAYRFGVLSRAGCGLEIRMFPRYCGSDTKGSCRVLPWLYALLYAPSDETLQKPFNNNDLENMAVREGFEPSIPCDIHTFQACSFGHSDTSPFLSPARYLDKALRAGFLKAANSTQKPFQTQCFCIPVPKGYAIRFKKPYYLDGNSLTPTFWPIIKSG